MTRRICLQLDGMDAVIVRRDVECVATDAGPLTQDFYYPPERPAGGNWPAVIIVAGYPGPYKNLGWTVSMAQLVAVSGMVAVAYTDREPLSDLQAVFLHLQEHAPSLQVDASRVGVVAVSGNVPTALAALMQHASRPPACAVFGYGYMLDLDGSTEVADAAARWRFANPCEGKTVAELRQDVPLFIARAGRDEFPGVNASIDSFLRHALRANLPLTLVNYPEGAHAFDLFDDSPTSREIVLRSLRFLQHHLVASHCRI